jgi:multidrug resistance efflux pump
VTTQQTDAQLALQTARENAAAAKYQLQLQQANAQAATADAASNTAQAQIQEAQAALTGADALNSQAFALQQAAVADQNAITGQSATSQSWVTYALIALAIVVGFILAKKYKIL